MIGEEKGALCAENGDLLAAQDTAQGGGCEESKAQGKAGAEQCAEIGGKGQDCRGENVRGLKTAEGKGRADALKTPMPEKFKDVNALAEAYNVLQAEFTRRCQRLKQLEARLGDSKNGSSEGEKERSEAGGKADIPNGDFEKRTSGGGKAADDGGKKEPLDRREQEKAGGLPKVAAEGVCEKTDEGAESGESAEVGDVQKSREIHGAAWTDEELEKAVFANENVRLKVVGDYLSSLKKGGVALARGGAGTFASPPRKAASIEEAGGLALSYFRK